MTYFDRHAEIIQRLSTHRAGIAECEMAITELVVDMLNEIDTQQERIDTLEDELRRLREEKYLKDAY